MVSYPFSVYDETDITIKLALLANKLSIDLDLSGVYSTYSYADQVIEIEFTATLDSFQLDVLENLVDIIIYGAIVQQDIYVVDYNHFNRRSFAATNAPGPNHDVNCGYSIGSMVTLTDGNVYICTDNAATNAAWEIVSNTSMMRDSTITKKSNDVKSVVSPPIYMNFPTPLKMTKGWIYSSTNWETLSTLMISGRYRNIKLLGSFDKDTKVRVTTPSKKETTLFETTTLVTSKEIVGRLKIFPSTEPISLNLQMIGQSSLINAIYLF